MIAKNHKWLSFFCSTLNCSNNFCEVLARQLAEQIYIQTGIDIRNGFFLVPEPNSLVRYDQKNIAYLDVDLIGPDNFGYSSLISWRCEAHPDLQITPDNPLLPDGEYRLEAWWQVLPIEELKKYSEPPAPPIPETFSFPVEWEWFAWCDIYLELHTIEELSLEQIKLIEVALEQVRSDWNSDPKKHGIIHNWSGLYPIEDRKYEMKIDFGSTDYAALSHWLKALENLNHLLHLTRVIVRSVSLRS
jgi:hypothetical protein